MHGQGRSSGGRTVPRPPTQRRAKTLLGRANALLAHDAGGFCKVEPAELFEGVRGRLRDRADVKGVDLDLHATCNHVRVQPATFREALYELTHNAIAAARSGHAVVNEVIRTPQGDVLWHIHDRGAGMSERDLAELGLPRSTSGLGVMLAWAVVDRHGGLLRFESEPGRGTTATIWLPG